MTDNLMDHTQSPAAAASVMEPMAALPYQLLGKEIDKLPKDLYIPPEALHIFLESFQGPLDLLLYLIKKQNLDILDIPIAKITRQYINYIDLMQVMQFDLAAEYLVMAAMLAEIKSRMLLPRQAAVEDEDEGIDPRAELVRRLQEYERFKNAAQAIVALPQYERDTFPAMAAEPDLEHYIPAHPQVALEEIYKALAKVMQRVELNKKHTIEFEPLSVRERMAQILETLTGQRFTAFARLFTAAEGRMGVVVTLTAILELLRQSALEIVQAEPFAELHIKIKPPQEAPHHES